MLIQTQELTSWKVVVVIRFNLTVEPPFANTSPKHFRRKSPSQSRCDHQRRTIYHERLKNISPQRSDECVDEDEVEIEEVNNGNFGMLAVDDCAGLRSSQREEQAARAIRETPPAESCRLRVR